MGDTMQQRLTQDLTQFLASLPEDDRIKAINEIRMAIHQVSPFREEPVDCVLWVKNNQLMPNTRSEFYSPTISSDGEQYPGMVFTAMKLVKAHHH